jgi:hypothetical protein
VLNVKYKNKTKMIDTSQRNIATGIEFNIVMGNHNG